MRYERDNLPGDRDDDLDRGDAGRTDETAGYDVQRALDQGTVDPLDIAGENADQQRAMDQGDGDPLLGEEEEED